MANPFPPPASRLPVTVLGATGVVGQRFVRRLAAHPWFEIRHLAASDRSAGRVYSEACEWRLGGEPYAGFADRVLVPCTPQKASAGIVFSALDTLPARELEPLFAAAGAWVFSNASAFRMEDDVPLVIPEVNAAHLALVPRQRRERRYPGAIVCNPNCTATLLAMALAPLHAAFGVEAVLMTSMQAVSGAGYPGVPTLDILGNVIPYIRGEEEKVEEETRKMLGALLGEAVMPAATNVSAACHRVPVLDGHTEAVSLRLAGNPSLVLVREVLASFRALPQDLALPSAPLQPLVLHDRPERPQPRLDLAEPSGPVFAPDSGMTVHIGRLRECPVLGVKFVLLGHNAERGAAGASVLNAELAVASGWWAAD
ncbi:MAG: aspartate-semialdehyde dehydrogenase [Thermoanaerobaculia bacterium]